ncbi:MAG: hypothetical protein K9J13_12775 [Saprospiraceae bacterium]|nr:hypothetical protein [Saprospiraceae bacterium]
MKLIIKNFHFVIIALLISIPLYAQNTIPETNKIIVDYVETVIGKKVDRGECWDLAFQALSKARAKWDGAYNYGKLLDPEKDIIYPGDIIQFKNVKVKYKKGRVVYTESMTHHTAIVYKVIRKGEYLIAHQNTSEFKRKVGISELSLSNVVSGKLMFYRPVKG